ncbi:MAG: heme-binding protein [Salinivirgaceae bacterium]|jgi:uncharacterized protein GlcG (DUF336 family)|nr:heme-binding protein [Salinivirgaceae bacterium]
MDFITNKIIENIEKLIPQYLNNKEDADIANGNLAICIIDEEGTVNGKFWGTDKIRVRESYKVAWIKASQVWITGYKTQEFEKLAFSGEINDYAFGINRPDFIGWEGGQPVTLKDGTKLSIGFSGMRGENDLDIVIKAIEQL